MNIAILNLKNISKAIIKAFIIFFCITFLIKVLNKNIITLNDIISINFSSSVYSSFFNISNKSKIDETTIIGLISPVFVGFTEDNTPENKVKKIDNEEKVIANNLGNKITNIEKVEEKNIPENFNVTYSNVKIRNQSDYEITSDILSYENLDTSWNKKILIYHTHTCESYTPSEKYNYIMTGNYRTTDNNYNVVRVGEELTNILRNKGVEVIHNITYHDYPSYNGSYDRSLQTIENILEQNKDIKIVIDLHRDAVGDGSSYGPTVKINGQSVAQMMLVIGTDGGGLEHPNWQQNLKSAVKLQARANEKYPGLFRPIIVRNSRYNQHVAPGAWIIEVGATGNTLDECLLSMQYLAEVLGDIVSQ